MTAAAPLVERLARTVSTGCGCYDGRGLCESCRIAFDALLPVVEQAVAEARGEALREADGYRNLCRVQADLMAALRARVEAAAEREHAGGCHHRHQQGETDECNSCTAARIEAAVRSEADAKAWQENYDGMFWRWAECDAERLRLKDELESALLRLRCATPPAEESP